MRRTSAKFDITLTTFIRDIDKMFEGVTTKSLCNKFSCQENDLNGKTIVTVIKWLLTLRAEDNKFNFSFYPSFNNFMLSTFTKRLMSIIMKVIYI